MGRAFIGKSAVKSSTFADATWIGSLRIIQSTTSLHGGVVSDPSYFQYPKDLGSSPLGSASAMAAPLSCSFLGNAEAILAKVVFDPPLSMNTPSTPRPSPFA